MTDISETAPKPKPSLWLEFGPLLVFFISLQVLKRNNPDGAMLQAAGIFAFVAVLAVIISWVRHKAISPILIFSTFVIVVFALLAIAFNNKVIFFIKPTIMNILFGIGVIGGTFINRNVLKMLVGSAFEMPLEKWNVLAIRWGLFFFFCAALNEVIWRNFSEDFWAGFKVFGFMPLTLVFTLTQIPFIQKYGKVKSQD